MTALQRYSNPAFEPTSQSLADLVQIVAKTVASSRARIYRQTFDKWARWTTDNRLTPFALTPANVAAFLDSAF